MKPIGNLANDFTEILPTLSQNKDLFQEVYTLIKNRPILGKVIEESDRLETFRDILKDLVANKINLNEAYERTEVELPRHKSKHSHNNKVFAKGWAERLVRIQLSRFYNQTVMEKLIAEGHEQCYVPHSTEENPSSPCSQHLAGSNHDLKNLYNLLIDSYEDEHCHWTKEVKIPNHPHCTHVVTFSK